MVAMNHPLILKAQLYDEINEAYLLKSKGVLDPQILSDYTTKDFKDKDYFSVWQTEAIVPTTLPIDFSVGYERNNGDFLNNENTVPSKGLVYGTLNLSILRGLLFDDQRFQIQNAQLKGVQNKLERTLLTRELLYQAANAYLDWAIAHYNTEILDDYLDAILDRHENVIQLYLNGDKPAVDTIESRLNINSANKNLLSAKSTLIKMRQNASLFLWDSQTNPLNILGDVNPENISACIQLLNDLALLYNFDAQLDPYMLNIGNKIEQVTLKNKLEREMLKPQLDLKYNTILNLGEENIDPTFRINDYKYGLTFALPIRNRKTRGEIKLNEAIISQKELDQIHYGQTLYNKLEGLVASRELQEEQIQVIQEKIENSQALLEAEQLKFNLGESSVFMLNQRERKLLEANLDLIMSYHKLGYTFTDLYYLSLGQN